MHIRPPDNDWMDRRLSSFTVSHGGVLAMIAALALSAASLLAACVGATAPSGPQSLKVTAANDYVVRGEYQFVNRDVNPAVDLPPDADPARRVLHWALVTDAHVDGHRVVTFTQSESVKDVSIELPDSEAPLRFAAYASRTGDGEVLVFAAGDGKARSSGLLGHVLINRR